MLRRIRIAALRGALLVCALTLANCGGKEPDDGKVGLEFGEGCYRIPRWNARLINGSAGFPFSERRKSTRSLRLQFSNAEIREQIQGYELPLTNTGSPIEGELVSFFAPSPSELEQIRRNQQAGRGQFYALWYAEGDWTQRTIEPAPVPGLYRVSFFPNGNSWQVVTKLPDMKARLTHLEKEFWIGGCYAIEGPSRTSCSMRRLEHDGIFLDASTTESNLPFREQLKRYFLEKLETWKVPCS